MGIRLVRPNSLMGMVPKAGGENPVTVVTLLGLRRSIHLQPNFRNGFGRHFQAPFLGVVQAPFSGAVQAPFKVPLSHHSDVVKVPLEAPFEAPFSGVFETQLQCRWRRHLQRPSDTTGSTVASTFRRRSQRRLGVAGRAVLFWRCWCAASAPLGRWCAGAPLKWKEHVIIVLGCMDLDYALRVDRPSNLTSASTAEQRSTMEKWERSNRMSLMIMKHSILETIRGAIPEETQAKAFLNQIANRLAVNEKVETSTILSKLVSIRLKALKLELSEDILVHLVLISLPTKFSPFKISYNTQNEKWTLNELIAQCVQEEERLKQEKIESAHLASTSQGFGANKKRKRDNKGKQTAVSETSK
ncbi:hypothetical protein CK203_098978 [Vitis vinifera]|uniref:Uncharacterized protein n=1 Tax=Vitis vinifera TaxID=29760 RepID=A0A438CHF8_VITVI|nr:hypothetical protein CK203_098978 [Vitis vinifera]